MKYFISLLAVCMVLAGCPPKERLVGPPPPPPPPVEEAPPPPPQSVEAPLYQLLEMTRTNCMGGKCRNYVITIWSNGNAEFKGIANVDRIGSFYGKLSKAQMDGLRASANAAGIYSLSDSYPVDKRWILDMSSVMITFRDGDLVKKIRDNYDSPKSLKDFEAYVDKLIESTDWHIVD